MNSLTMMLQIQTGNGGDILTSKGPPAAARPLSSDSERESFGRILNERNQPGPRSSPPVDEGRARPGRADDGDLPGESCAAGKTSKDGTAVESLPQAPRNSTDTPDANFSGSSDQGTAADAVPALTQPFLSRTSSPAPPESHAALVHGSGKGHAAGGRPGSDGQAADPGGTQRSAAFSVHSPEASGSAIHMRPAASSNGVMLPEEAGSDLRRGAPGGPEKPSAKPADAEHAGQNRSPLTDRAAANPAHAQEAPAADGLKSRLLREAFTQSDPASPTAEKTPAADLPRNRLNAAVKAGQKGAAFAAASAEAGEMTLENPAAMREPSASPALTGRMTEGIDNGATAAGRIIPAGGRNSLPVHTEWIGTVQAPESGRQPTGVLPVHRIQAVIDQIMDARQNMTGDFGRVRIVLSPPNLGNVDLQIILRRERIGVVMTADNAIVQQALLSRADDIRIALERHDFRIETFQVLLEEQTANHHQARGGAMFEQHREHREKQNFSGGESLLSAAAALSDIGAPKAASGQVSIFV